MRSSHSNDDHMAIVNVTKHLFDDGYDGDDADDKDNVDDDVNDVMG